MVCLFRKNGIQCEKIREIFARVLIPVRECAKIKTGILGGRD